MTCPDRTQLNEWISGKDESTIDEHVAACLNCQSLVESMAISEVTMRQSLRLSGVELRYLERANLADQVRGRVASTQSRNTWTLSVIGLAVLGGVIAWQIIYPAVEMLIGLATRAGAGMIALDLVLWIAATLVAGVATFAMSPVADLMPIIAAVAAIALWVHTTNTSRPLLSRAR